MVASSSTHEPTLEITPIPLVASSSTRQPTLENLLMPPIVSASIDQPTLETSRAPLLKPVLENRYASVLEPEVPHASLDHATKNLKSFILNTQDLILIPRAQSREDTPLETGSVTEPTEPTPHQVAGCLDSYSNRVQRGICSIESLL